MAVLLGLPDEWTKPNVVVKIADKINKQRQQELFHAYLENNEFKQYLKDVRESRQFQYGNKSKTMRKIASYPRVVDEFFTKVYGPDYFKEKDFFTKYAQEWLVISPLDV